MNTPVCCLLLAGSILAATPSLAADLLVHNVRGYTLQSGRDGLKRFDSLLVAGGKVVATGSEKTLAARAGDARRIDGRGRVMLPGLIDAHGHVIALGQTKVQADLTATTTLSEALFLLKSYAAGNVEAPWLRGRGWNQAVWELGRFPTATELDSAIAERPAWLVRVDGHAGWANSKALALAGITRETPDPVGGKIVRDESSQPTGVLVDSAMALITRVLPKTTPRETELALKAALTELGRVGITSVHDAGIDADTFSLYKAYADASKLTLRLYAMISGVEGDFDLLASSGPLIGHGRDFLTVRSVKLYADGALGSRGAALIEPYSDDPANRGLLFQTPQNLSAAIGKALARGYQVNVHAIGDRATQQVLDSFAAVYRAQGGRQQRNRIEHAQVVAPEDFARFRALALIASMQPTHATSDKNMAEDRVGGTRIRGAYAWQSFRKQGTTIAAGSDFPVESPNPFFGLHAAVTRQDRKDQPPRGWYPEQALSLVQALRAFTLDAAYAAHQEKSLGSLEPGKWADFVLIDQDIFALPPQQIWKTEVLETWVAGRRVFARS